MTAADGIDRLSIRQRPDSLPIMHQSWQKLLFIHWELPPELLRPHIPDRLTLDTYDGKAWIAITPFLVTGARPVFLPPMPCLSTFKEINVRTYVHFNGVPGVWFFSLDASSVLAVLGATAGFSLPYHAARMELRERGKDIFYSSKRAEPRQQPVEFEANWRKGGLLGEAQVDSLEFFLVERYCLYALSGKILYRARIHHKPWQLQDAELVTCRSTMIEGQGLPKPAGTPLLHYSERQDTSIWPLQRVA
jgi:uncharacterized protein